MIPSGRGADLTNFDAAVASYVDILRDFDGAIARAEFNGGELGSQARRYLGRLRELRQTYMNKDWPAVMVDRAIEDAKSDYDILLGAAGR